MCTEIVRCNAGVVYRLGQPNLNLYRYGVSPMRSRLVVTWLCGLGSLLVAAADLAAQSTASSATAAQATPRTSSSSAIGFRR